MNPQFPGRSRPTLALTVSILTDPPQGVFRRILGQAPPSGWVPHWLLFSGFESRILEAPEIRSWARSFVELGGLTLLADEKLCTRPPLHTGKGGVALASGLLPYTKAGTRLIVEGSADELERDYLRAAYGTARAIELQSLFESIVSRSSAPTEASLSFPNLTKPKGPDIQ